LLAIPALYSRDNRRSIWKSSDQLDLDLEFNLDAQR